MNRYERFKSPTGLSKKDTIALESAAKKTGFGDLATKRSERVKSKNVKNAKSVLTKAQNKYKKAEKAYKGKKFSATKNAKNLKSSINTAKSNLSAANKTPVKNAKDVLNRAIKKHGKGKVIKMMAKKLGARGAIGLLAKTGLAAAGPIGTLVGGGLLMADIAAIYTILSDLAE
jgi:electron transfer flavoprotein alpha subunit